MQAFNPFCRFILLKEHYSRSRLFPCGAPSAKHHPVLPASSHRGALARSPSSLVKVAFPPRLLSARSPDRQASARWRWGGCRLASALGSSGASGESQPPNPAERLRAAAPRVGRGSVRRRASAALLGWSAREAPGGLQAAAGSTQETRSLALWILHYPNPRFRVLIFRKNHCGLIFLLSDNRETGFSHDPGFADFGQGSKGMSGTLRRREISWRFKTKMEERVGVFISKQSNKGQWRPWLCSEALEHSNKSADAHICMIFPLTVRF